MEQQIQQDQQVQPNLQSSPPAAGMAKWIKLSLATVLTLVVVVCGYLLYKTTLVKPVIKSYEECVEAQGSTVQLSYPSVCVTKDGARFAQ